MRLRRFLIVSLVLHCCVFIFLLFLFPEPPGHLKVIVEFGSLDKVAGYDQSLAGELRKHLDISIEGMRFLSLVALGCIALGIWAISATLFSLRGRDDFPGNE